MDAFIARVPVVNAPDSDTARNLSESVVMPIARWEHAGGMTSATYFSYVGTPFGRLLLVGQDRVLTGLYLADHDRAPVPHPLWEPDDEALAEPRRQIDEYFAQGRQRFDLPLNAVGTPFQQATWRALQGIPYGE